MKVTIISDNTVHRKELMSEWGFSAFIEVENLPNILFDTGASGSVLMYNIEKLDINPESVDSVVISHNHWDHRGGLDEFLKVNSKVKLYLPYTFTNAPEAEEVIRVREPVELYKNVYSTGELENVEQSLLVKLDKGLVVIAGCSHPGVGNILNRAKDFGNPIALIGGLHGFNEFNLLKDLELICATHCTQYKEKIKELYPKEFTPGGSGMVIKI